VGGHRHALLHGDFHTENVLIGREGPSIIDWTNASRGDPHGDVARTLLILRRGGLRPGTPTATGAIAAVGRRFMTRRYLVAYEGHSVLDADRLRKWGAVQAPARLAEEITEERASLLAALERYRTRV
jgi:aminoglycoside phosphotransferase (APT) family kinase protein